MRVRIASEPAPGHAENEDHGFQSGPLVAVLDGVTAPAGIDTGCVHGPAWYVRRLTTHLADVAGESPAAPLDDSLAEAIRRVRDDHDDRCDLTNPATPAATACLVREAGDRFDYLLLSDCTLVFEHGDQVDAITDERFQIAVAELRRDVLPADVGIDGAKHSDLIRQFMIRKSQLTNQPNGYWIAAANPDAAHHAITGSLPLTGPERVQRAALLTDGTSCAVDEYGLMDWPQLLDLLAEHGPHELIRRVRQAENADPDGHQHPRYKRHDDATAALCIFEESR